MGFPSSFRPICHLESVFWQACILAIIAFHGVGLLSIDTSVLIALLTTTTVNVFAFLVIVMKFVFASPDSK